MTKEWWKPALTLWTRVHSAFRQKAQEEEAEGQRKRDFLLHRHLSHPWPPPWRRRPGIPAALHFHLVLARGPVWCQARLTSLESP